MSLSRDVHRSFPQLESIDDDTLREQVVSVWVDAIEDSQYETLEDITWMPEAAPGTTLVTHVNTVTDVALGLCETLTKRNDVSIDTDVVSAGALLHDVSKLAEASDETVGNLIPHPHYAVHLLGASGIDEHVMHVALAHTERTNVPPKTPEAHIVHHADYLAAQIMILDASGSLPERSVLVPSTESC